MDLLNPSTIEWASSLSLNGVLLIAVITLWRQLVAERRERTAFLEALANATRGESHADD